MRIVFFITVLLYSFSITCNEKVLEVFRNMRERTEWAKELDNKIQNQQFPHWMLEQIHEDLKPFRDHGVSEFDFQETWATCQSGSDKELFVLCQFNQGQLSYAPEIKDTDSRAYRLLGSLMALSHFFKLPDVKFIVYTSESFIKDFNTAPILTWCRHTNLGEKAVNIPDYEALVGNYDFLNQVNLGRQRYPWSKKLDKAVWRGNLTGGFCDPNWGKEDWDYMLLPRILLTKASLQHPELLDAKLIGQIGRNQETRIYKKTLPYRGDYISVSESIKYKFQINVDGYVTAFSRCYWQLFSGCVMLKQSSPWYQWYFRALHPYEHYIPYAEDASDLISKIQWAINNEDKCKEIAQNALYFADNNLKHSDVMLYVYLLINELANLNR